MHKPYTLWQTPPDPRPHSSQPPKRPYKHSSTAAHFRCPPTSPFRTGNRGIIGFCAKEAGTARGRSASRWGPVGIGGS